MVQGAGPDSNAGSNRGNVRIGPRNGVGALNPHDRVARAGCREDSGLSLANRRAVFLRRRVLSRPISPGTRRSSALSTPLIAAALRNPGSSLSARQFMPFCSTFGSYAIRSPPFGMRLRKHPSFSLSISPASAATNGVVQNETFRLIRRAGSDVSFRVSPNVSRRQAAIKRKVRYGGGQERSSGSRRSRLTGSQQSDWLRTPSEIEAIHNHETQIARLKCTGVTSGQSCAGRHS